MKRLNIGMIAAIFLLTQVAIAGAAPLPIKELTGDDAPNTVIGWVVRLDLDRNVMVVGDTPFRFTADTVYLSEDNKPVDKSSFTEESTVRYLAEDRNILAIWHISGLDDDYRPKNENAEETNTPPEIAPLVSKPSALDGVIKKQNGVWTN